LPAAKAWLKSEVARAAIRRSRRALEAAYSWDGKRLHFFKFPGIDAAVLSRLPRNG